MRARSLLGYDLVEPLGKGGMGAVFRARDSRGNTVALKLLQEALASEPDARRRFERECGVLVDLVHPRIVRALTGLLAQENDLFYVMELIEGEDLARVLARRGSLPWHEALSVCADLLEALAFAHARGILHRDVKPANVFLERDGHAKLGDFGLAHAAGHTRLTNTGALVGTAGYLAPEQVEGGAPSEKTDLYSTGVLLYEMLAGHPPFQAPSPLAVLRMHVDRSPPPLPGSVPAGVARVALRALEKDPACRFDSAASMLEAVRSILASKDEPLAPTPAERSLAQAETRELLLEPPREKLAPPTPAHAGDPAAATATAVPLTMARGRSRRAPYGILAFIVLLGIAVVARFLASDAPVRRRPSPAVVWPAPNAPFIHVKLKSGEEFDGVLQEMDLARGFLVTETSPGNKRQVPLDDVLGYQKVQADSRR